MEYDEIDPTAPIVVEFGPDNPNWQGKIEFNRKFLVIQVSLLNDRMFARGHLFVNEALDSLGFQRIPQGALVGWTRPNAPYVTGDFSPKENGRFGIRFYPQGFIWDKI